MADLVIRGGRVATADAVFAADVAIENGLITGVGEGLGPAAREIDANGNLVLPGGVDTHCHIEQLSGFGVMGADTFETAHRSAAFGGTTCTISFATQPRGTRLRDAMADYAARAQRGALIDHAFHAIIADTSGSNLTEDLPALIAEGHRSLKIFTTYDNVKLGDAEILSVLSVARDHGALPCFHAENDGMIGWATARLLAEGKHAPKYHAASHPRAAEIEALSRICHFSELTGQPVMLFHISTAEGVEVIRAARARGTKVVAETCPHYLFMTEKILDQPGVEGAKYLCSPPQRAVADQEALWAALADGTLSLVTSDHAPYRFDGTGKFRFGRDVPFNRMANGMPGLETRLPMMFDALVSQGRGTVSNFVRLTATAPAEIFGLTGKGRIAPGADGDVVIWDPEKTHTYGADDLHDNCGYNPYAGTRVKGMPVTTISRGKVVVENGQVTATPGQGRRVPLALSAAMQPG